MAEKYMSGEEYQEMQHSHTSKSTGKSLARIPLRGELLIAVIVLCGLSFVGGVIYQKHSEKTTTTATSAAGGALGAGGFSRRGGGNFGQVTAVSTTSITLTNQRTNASNTYAITGATVITDNGQTVATSDIQAGDTVVITTSTSDTSTATRILVNPSFGGAGSPSPTSQTNTDGTTSD